MLRVLFLTSLVSRDGAQNVGDRVILAGARNLIAGAFGHYAYREHGRWDRFPDDPDEFDLIVYAGMPQYANREGPTTEENHLADLLNRARKALFINIGGGTTYRLGQDLEEAAESMAKSGIADYYKRQTGVRYRSSRDKVSKMFFDKIGVPCELRFCPSFFSTKAVEPGEKKTSAVAALNDQTFVTDRYRGSLRDLLRRLHLEFPSWDMISHDGSDLALFADLRAPHIYFRDEMALIGYYAGVDKLISLRIHGAVPAWALGADVVVAGFDGRIEMFDDVGVPVPWVNMIKSPEDRLSEIVNDPSRHLKPLGARLAKIDEQFDRMIGEIRTALPELVARSSDHIDPAALAGGLKTYPPEGQLTNNARTQGFDLVRRALPISIGDEKSDAGCVLIPAGGRAAKARQSVVFPLTVPVSKFSSQMAVRAGQAMVSPLAGKSGSFLFGPYLNLPRDSYKVELELDFALGEGDEKSGKIEVQVYSPLGRYIRYIYLAEDFASELRRGGGSLSLEFMNAYPASSVEFIVRASGFQSPSSGLSFRGAIIDTLRE